MAIDGGAKQNEIDDLAIDNSERTGLLSTPGCEIKINDGGSITTLVGDHATFGGNAKVTVSGEATGQQTCQDHGPLRPLTFKALTVQAVICNDERSEKDAGEPGTSDMYGIVIPGVAYASGDQRSDGGNVQIR